LRFSLAASINRSIDLLPTAGIPQLSVPLRIGRICIRIILDPFSISVLNLMDFKTPHTTLPLFSWSLSSSLSDRDLIHFALLCNIVGRLSIIRANEDVTLPVDACPLLPLPN
jgi:hypothetical protein